MTISGYSVVRDAVPYISRKIAHLAFWLPKYKEHCICVSNAHLMISHYGMLCRECHAGKKGVVFSSKLFVAWSKNHISDDHSKLGAAKNKSLVQRIGNHDNQVFHRTTVAHCIENPINTIFHESKPMCYTSIYIILAVKQKTWQELSRMATVDWLIKPTHQHILIEFKWN
jgi:hypothetical protein